MRAISQLLPLEEDGGGAGNVPSYSWESRSLFNQGKVVSDEEGVRY